MLESFALHGHHQTLHLVYSIHVAQSPLASELRDVTVDVLWGVMW